MNVQLTVGSLFSGIGGFDLGLERAGMRTAWFCERDEFCQRVLAKHWPDAPCYPDITRLRAADVEPVDVLCGGFPCQDLSVAGERAGIDGGRSGLWGEYARLIGEIRPRYVVVENVAALLSGDRGRWFGRVLGDLAALGYDAEWDCIPASAVGAPHRRDRVWIVAYPNGPGSQGRPVSICKREEVAGAGDSGPLADADRIGAYRGGAGAERAGREEPADGRGDVPDTAVRTNVAGIPQSDQRPVPQGAGRSGREHSWAVEPDVGRVAHGVPARVDRLRSLGNALVPQIAEWIGERIVSYEYEGTDRMTRRTPDRQRRSFPAVPIPVSGCGEIAQGGDTEETT